MADPVALLGALELFAAARPEELAALAGRSRPRRLARGQVLFIEGEPSEHLFVVVAGRLKVMVTSPHGEELILAVVGPGEAVGELSIVDGLDRSAGAEALEATELLAVPAEAVRELLARSPAVALDLAVALAGTVRRLTGSAADLVFLDLPRRLAKLLLEFAGPDGRDVELGMSQAEVAARLGVTRQSLNRALGALARRGWIDPQGSHVRLADRAALARFAGS